MKKSLYEIEKEFEDINERLAESEGVMTPELETALAIAQTDLQTKGVGYGLVILQNKADIAAIKAEIDRLQKKLKPLENANERLENAISDAMQHFGIEEIKTPVVKLNFRKSKSVEIVDASAIPQTLMVHVPETWRPDKAAIKSVLEDGGEVPCAYLSHNKNLQIK